MRLPLSTRTLSLLALVSATACTSDDSPAGDDGATTGGATTSGNPTTTSTNPTTTAADGTTAAESGDSTGSGSGGEQGATRSSSASYADPVVFSGSQSTAGAAVFGILPGPAAIDPTITPTPFSNSIDNTEGSYSITVSDTTPGDSEDSTDAVTSVNILFTGADGRNYLIDGIEAIHKAEGAGAHTFFGGVGSNEIMHGDTAIGTPLMPKMLAYFTLWGLADLKDADTGEIVAAGRVVHIMTATRVRNDDLTLITSVDVDASDHDRTRAETHVILPPQNMAGEMDPIPGTDHGFIHMMFSDVELTEPSRDPTLAYEILPGPSVIDPKMSPTPFSNRIALGSGSYSLEVTDIDAEDSMESTDIAGAFDLSFRLDDGTEYTMDSIEIIHKAEGTGDHSFFGGVGYDVTMHGDTQIGTGLMPKMVAYVTLWGIADLKNGAGEVVAPDRMIHMMVGSRVRDENLGLSTDTVRDTSDPSDDAIETHIILPPMDAAGEMSPIPGTRHGFLHLMFEGVDLVR